MNQLFNELGGMSNINMKTIQNLKSVMKRLQTLQNPSKELESLISSNPSMKEILSIAQKQNLSLKDLYYFLAKQQGVNPNDILEQLK